MKKTYRKVILRTLKGTFSRFIAIAAIVALGVGLLSGLLAMPIDMRVTVDNYFDRQHLHDLRVVSMLGLTDDDVSAIAAVEGIDEVMPAYMADVFIDAGEEKNIVTRIHSLPSDQIEEKDPVNYLNRIDVLEGRLPLRPNECVIVERNTGDGTGSIALGETLHVADTNGDISDTLADTDFKIVGIAHTSYYFSVGRESATIGDGTVALKMYVGEESFSQEAYSEIFMTVKGAAELGSETQEYRDLVDSAAERVEEIADARCTARYEEVKADIETTLADARVELADARAEADEKFADAEQQLSDAEDELSDAESELISAKNQIESGQKELDSNRASLPGTLQEQTAALAAGKAELAAGKQQIADTEAFLAQKRQELADAKAQIAGAKQLVTTLEPSVVQAEEHLAELAAMIPPLQEEYDAAQEAYDKGVTDTGYAEKKTAADAAAAVTAEKQSAADAAQQAVTGGMAAAECETEEAWLAKEPEKAAPLLLARDNANLELETAKNQQTAADTEFAAAAAALAPLTAARDQAKTKLDSANAAYDTAATALTSIRSQLDSTKKMIAEGEPQIAEGEKQLAEGEKQLAAGKKQLMDAERAIIIGEASLNIAPTIAQMEMELAENQLEDARTQYEDGMQQFEDGKAEFEKSEAEYREQKADAEQQLADAEQQIRDGEEQLADLEVPEWMVMDRSYHVSASSFLSDVDKLEAITTVFPIFFFLVAALVALTTMTRMVDEERLQIGTLKALGYQRGQIMIKYLFYAWFATIIGGFAGLAFGFTVIPTVIWNAYGTMYTIPGFHCLYHHWIAFVGVGAALLCTSLATWNACSHTLKEWAAQLLLPKAPMAGKRILLERITPVWKRMKFTHKVTARNLFRYKKRFFMTVIGVAGCTALLVTGFGLKDSIGDIVSKQFGDVFVYDFVLTLSDEDALEDETFRELVDDPENIQSHLAVHQERITLEYDDQKFGTYIFVPEEESRLPKFVDLHERKSRTELPLSDDGVIVTEKFSTKSGLGPGDLIDIKNEEGHTATFTITGVAENYVENYAYMTRRTYENAFHDEPSYNSLLCILPGDAEEVPEELSTQLLDVSGVAGMTQMSTMRRSLDETIASINYVVYVIILCAGMLAFVVLYNLMNINITERSKEIATIKVLGFYPREVEGYIYRESNILSLIGMLAGLVAGIFLHRFIMDTVEVDMVMFGHDIKPLSFLLSAVLTLVFSQLVNLGMRRKLRNISMVESMKAPE